MRCEDGRKEPCRGSHGEGSVMTATAGFDIAGEFHRLAVDDGCAAIAEAAVASGRSRHSAVVGECRFARTIREFADELLVLLG